MQPTIYDYSVLLQLLAGTSIAFFYQDILKNLVANNRRKELQSKWEIFKGRLHDYFESDVTYNTDTFDSQEEDLDKEFHRIADDSELTYYKRGLTYVGKISFVYLVMLLAIGAFEVHQSNVLDYKIILLSSVIYFILSVEAIVYCHKKKYKDIWYFIRTATIPVVFTIWSIFGSTFVDKLLPFSSDFLPTVIVGIFFLVILIGSIRFYYNRFRIKLMLDEFERIDRDFKFSTKWAINPTRENAMLMGTEIRHLFEDSEDTQTAIDKFNFYQRERVVATLKRHESWVGFKRVTRKWCIDHYNNMIDKILPGVITVMIISYILIDLNLYLNR